METPSDERMKSVLFGLGLAITGPLFMVPLNAGAMIVGLMLVGFGLVPKATDYPEDDVPLPAMSRSEAAAEVRPEKKKKTSRKKK